MKTAIYIANGVPQLVITPETEFEKKSLNPLRNVPTTSPNWKNIEHLPTAWYVEILDQAVTELIQSIPEEMLLEWLDKLIDLTKKIPREEERTVARAIEQGMVTGVLSGLRDIITSGFMEGEEK